MESKQPVRTSKAPTSGSPLSVSVPGLVILNSKPGGGKSHLMRYIVYLHRKEIAHAIAFSKSCFRPGNLDYIPNYEATPKDVKEFLNFKHMCYNGAVLQRVSGWSSSLPGGSKAFGIDPRGR